MGLLDASRQRREKKTKKTAQQAAVSEPEKGLYSVRCPLTTGCRRQGEMLVELNPSSYISPPVAAERSKEASLLQESPFARGFLLDATWQPHPDFTRRVSM